MDIIARSNEHGIQRSRPLRVVFVPIFLYSGVWGRDDGMDMRLYQALQANPIIAAVRDEEGLQRCLEEDVQTVFVLYGDICGIGDIVRRIKAAGKIAIVHADLISGLSAKEISVDFLHSTTQADGIISTRTNTLQRAKELGMITIFRVFVIDSMALDSLLSIRNLRPDAIDILPGLMPTIIRKVRALTGLPVLTGGLITEKQEVLQALEAGALAISSTSPAVWQM